MAAFQSSNFVFHTWKPYCYEILVFSVLTAAERNPHTGPWNNDYQCLEQTEIRESCSSSSHNTNIEIDNCIRIHYRRSNINREKEAHSTVDIRKKTGFSIQHYTRNKKIKVGNYISKKRMLKRIGSETAQLIHALAAWNIEKLLQLLKVLL